MSSTKNATRGELAVSLQAGRAVTLPETTWPDVKTDGQALALDDLAFGAATDSDGKFHADAVISNATVAAFALPCGAGSPAVKNFSLCGC